MVKKSSRATWRNVANVKKELEDTVHFHLGPDELRILLRVARRLRVGYEKYGLMRLKKDHRDYQKEASEELLDWLVYTEMQKERSVQRKKSRTKK